ncbi:MAG: Eco57I restriction-modification methylase domain-containing protein, partial [Acidimicrobiales bacterium]
PVLPPETYEQRTPWDLGRRLDDWVLDRVLELTYTAWDLEGFALDLGYDGPPFRWDDERRVLLRAELDACYFHLYGIERDDVDYILSTFPIVKRKDRAAHGEFRTRRLILQIFDAMSKATETTEPYQTILDPPPADPSTAHPDTRRPT